MGDGTFVPFASDQSTCVAVTSPLPPVRMARPPVPLRPPIQYSTPSLYTGSGHMYQPMPDLHLQSCLPVSASKDFTSPIIAVITSVVPSARGASTGACQESFTPPAFH